MSSPKNKVELRQLTIDEGGGWLATFPDLPGCMSDGETPEEALRNAAEAETAWLAVNENGVRASLKRNNRGAGGRKSSECY